MFWKTITVRNRQCRILIHIWFNLTPLRFVSVEAVIQRNAEVQSVVGTTALRWTFASKWAGISGCRQNSILREPKHPRIRWSASWSEQAGSANTSLSRCTGRLLLTNFVFASSSMTSRSVIHWNIKQKSCLRLREINILHQTLRVASMCFICAHIGVAGMEKEKSIMELSISTSEGQKVPGVHREALWEHCWQFYDLFQPPDSSSSLLFKYDPFSSSVSSSDIWRRLLAHRSTMITVVMLVGKWLLLIMCIYRLCRLIFAFMHRRVTHEAAEKRCEAICSSIFYLFWALSKWTEETVTEQLSRISNRESLDLQKQTMSPEVHVHILLIWNSKYFFKDM